MFPNFLLYYKLNNNMKHTIRNVPSRQIVSTVTVSLIYFNSASMIEIKYPVYNLSSQVKLKQRHE